MSAFGIGAVCFGALMLAMGVSLVVFRRQVSALLVRRAERAAAQPSFMFAASYLLFVGAFGGAIGIAAIAVGVFG